MRGFRQAAVFLLAVVSLLAVPANGGAATHHVEVTLHNADDFERLLLNGIQVAAVGYNESATVDLGELPSTTQLLLEVRNGTGGYTWGLTVAVDGSTVIDDKAGTVGVVGANGNDNGHQLTVVHRLQFTASGEVLERFNAGRNEPSSWCGSTRSSDDLAHEVANGGAKWHAIYAYPNDAANRFEALSGYLASSALAAQGILTSTRSKPLRYDMGTDCGARYLDITAVRLDLTTSQLDNSGDKYWPVVGDLVGQGFNALDKNYLVFLDSGGGSACGLTAAAGSGDQRTPDNGHNNDGAYAILYRYADPSTPESGGLCGGAALHEMLHAMGAVPGVAPNSDGGGHCNDASDDVMCGGPFRGGGPFVDYGSDDYWDPAGGQLGWWTVNLNRFFCAATTCNNGDPTRAPLTGREIGPVDFIGYCQNRGETAALVGEEASQPEAAYHWRCGAGAGASSIDVHEVCRAQYGTWDGDAVALDVDDAFSWQCLSDLNPPPPDPEEEEEEGGGTSPPPGGDDAIGSGSGALSQSGDFGASASERCAVARRRVRVDSGAVRRAHHAYTLVRRAHGQREAKTQQARRNLRAACHRLSKDRRRAARVCAVSV